MMPTPNVWLITGCSSGIGEALAISALDHGDTVVATARNPDRLAGLAAKGAVTEQLDVTSDDASIAATIESILAKVGGKIDILVNNAGYNIEGGVEECSADEVSAQFNTNVFGALKVLRAVLPVMRNQRSGVVAMLGSLLGWVGAPASGIYCATKGSDSLIAESLRAENSHLGIKVTVLELGSFRTNFLTPGNRLRAAKMIEDIKPVVEGACATYTDMDRCQPGDPFKAAKLIVEALTGTGRCVGRELPERLPLGRDAYDTIYGRMDLHRKNMEAWRDLATALDVD